MQLNGLSHAVCPAKDRAASKTGHSRSFLTEEWRRASERAGLKQGGRGKMGDSRREWRARIYESKAASMSLTLTLCASTDSQLLGQS
jgi:hypothetical protein